MGVGISRSAAFNSIRSLLCTTTNATPHERFFIFQRRSATGMSLPSWMTTGSKAFMKRFVRHSKSDPLVDEVEIMHVNPNYAQVRCPNGREMTVSLRNLAPCPQEDTADEEPDSPLTPVNNEEASNLENDLPYHFFFSFRGLIFLIYIFHTDCINCLFY